MHFRIRDVEQLLEMSVLFLTVPQLLLRPPQIFVTSHDREFVFDPIHRLLWDWLSTSVFTYQPAQFLCEKLELRSLLEPLLRVYRRGRTTEVALNLQHELP
jgi:hypothetical protein